MRKHWLLMGVLALTVPTLGTGCGDSPGLQNTKMSEEEIRKMEAADKQIEDEERSGSGTAVGKKKKGR